MLPNAVEVSVSSTSSQYKASLILLSSSKPYALPDTLKPYFDSLSLNGKYTLDALVLFFSI